ncbi:regulatory LuxR family protein [Mangrovibacterium diazotrophicum]|uniref:Regulatory LuxR family protein n=2 Tax=Mangrovibacterium diazotrophicum TaxID=1261403 RepID=A0A419VZ60_9BACT|nr:regulatory LuxR family protein [Mangrovibacterium diazotrophicum]
MVATKLINRSSRSINMEDSMLDYFFRTYNHGQMCSDISYDVEKDEILHLSENFRELTGQHCGQKFNQCLLFIKTIIHPEDYSTFLVRLVEFVKLDRAKMAIDPKSAIRSFTFRVNDSKQEWVSVKLHALMLSSNTLVGIVHKQNNLADEEPAAVSAREKEILNLIADGNSAKIIGDKLNISPNTVITHRNNLKKKFRAKNTAELIKEAVKSQVI